jgi:lipooligosaccharide transport system ATP-binding protein
MERRVIVEAKGLTKKYADRMVVDSLQLEVFQGECFGILGPNGAGKSTLMKMIYGSSAVTSGELFISGLNSRTNPREVKARIGVLPQDEGLDTDFTVRENLMLYSRYQGIDPEVAISRIEDLLKLMRLEESSEQYVHVLSGGMKRRLGIARAMINYPELLLLDEPTTGLDPQARLWIWSFLKKVKSEMGTIVLTTHYMEEAEQICDRVAIMNNGKILTIGNPRDLISEKIGTQVVEFHVARHELQYYLTRLTSLGFQYQVIRDQVNVYLPSADQVKNVLHIVSNLKVTTRPSTLSDVFLRLAGHDLRDEPL